MTASAADSTSRKLADSARLACGCGCNRSVASTMTARVPSLPTSSWVRL
ncbi:hypothetical protein [Pseudofulvimonas gallinarii]